MKRSALLARPSLALLAFLQVGSALAQDAPAVGGGAAGGAYPPYGCLTRREMIAAVTERRALPLRQVKGMAEQAGKGEMIDADLCASNGKLLYVVTVLGAGGKVSYVSLDAADGRLITLR